MNKHQCDTNMEEVGSMSCTAASQQGGVKTIGLHFYGAVMSSIFIYCYCENITLNSAWIVKSTDASPLSASRCFWRIILKRAGTERDTSATNWKLLWDDSWQTAVVSSARVLQTSRCWPEEMIDSAEHGGQDARSRRRNPRVGFRKTGVPRKYWCPPPPVLLRWLLQTSATDPPAGGERGGGDQVSTEPPRGS